MSILWPCAKCASQKNEQRLLREHRCSALQCPRTAQIWLCSHCAQTPLNETIEVAVRLHAGTTQCRMCAQFYCCETHLEHHTQRVHHPSANDVINKTHSSYIARVSTGVLGTRLIRRGVKKAQ